jgi:sugar phosphate permease
LIAGVVASGVLLMLLRYDPRIVPAFAATIVLLGGAVKAAQSAAWLPFAIDAIATIGVAVWFTRYLRNEPMRRAAGASPASATRAEAPQRESRP